MSNDKSIVQEQKLSNDESIVITRNGKHQYKFHRVFDMTRGRTADSELMPGVTTLAKHVGGDNFSIAMNWGLKQVRRSALLRLGVDADSLDSKEFKKAWESVKDNQFLTSDMEAPANRSQAQTASGNLLHEDIDAYIKDGTIPPEDHDLFMLWHRELGSRNYVSSEQLVVHEAMSYGGTVDAISKEADGYTLWDWKTKEADSFNKYGNYPNEFAQIAAYVQALRRTKHPYAPVKAYIANIMRDGSAIHVVPVDLDHGGRLFLTGYNMYHTIRDGEGKSGDRIPKVVTSYD